MNDKVRQQIEAKIEYAVQAIVEAAQEALETNSFEYGSYQLVFSPPADARLLVQSFLGPRIKAQVVPVLEEMFDLPVTFYNGHVNLQIENDKK